MKKVLCVGMVVLLVMLLVPLAALSTPAKVKSLLPTATTLKKEKEQEFFYVYNSESGKTELLSCDDYIFGVVAAEMPALYEVEALKAQAVAAYTFALYRKNENKDKDYDITTDYTVDQSYISKIDAKAKWGDKADEYTEKIEKAVKAVSGVAITYDSSVILSVYCASNSGKTQSAEEVWGGKYPYLVPVDSEWDKLDSSNISTVTLTSEQLKAKLSSLVEIGGEPSGWIKDIVKNSSGYVKKLTVCEKEISGSAIREALDLKSTAFNVSLTDDTFTFSVSGYGHGVGMSQVGANGMAQQSATYKEILTHYYTGCKIKKLN